MTRYSKRANMKNWKLWMSGLVLAAAIGGCKSNTNTAPAPIVDMNNQADPALANLAPVDSNAASAPAYPTSAPTSAQTSAPSSSSGRVLGQRSASPQSAPISEQYPEEGNYDPANDQAQVDAGEDAVYADQPPPPLPVYQQPDLTEANDQWTPGYWNYGNGGYFWVPGAWVAPPYTGALWTPGYWGYQSNRYRFHRGFWGRHIGFYGGVNYGFGYVGRGYEGGYWNNSDFYYNRAVNRVNVVSIHNVYQRNVTVINDNHYSYNGPGGYQVRPIPAELAVYHEQRLPPMQVQRQNMIAAQQNRQQFFADNHGRPAVAVSTARFSADIALPRAIEPPQRGGFGAQQNNQGVIQAHQAEQFREQQAQQQQALHNQQVQTQQRGQQEQVRAQQEQQRSQQEQQRNQQEQQRNAQLQQRQQAQVQNAQAQQRNAQAAQRTAQAQQQNAQAQQRTEQNQQRTEQAQQRTEQNQQRTEQAQQRNAQQQQAQQQRAVPQPHVAPAPQPQQARPQPQPVPARPAPAPRPQAAPAPAPHAQPQPHEGGERPHR